MSQPPAPLRKTLQTRDGAISYLEWDAAPDKPLLLFSHANGFNASTYRSLLSPLARDFRIIAWDMRGHGLTTLPLDNKSLHGWRIFRDDLLRFIDGDAAAPGHTSPATDAERKVA